MFGGGDQDALPHQAGGVTDSGDVPPTRRNLEVLEIGTQENYACRRWRRSDPDADTDSAMESDPGRFHRPEDRSFKAQWMPPAGRRKRRCDSDKHLNLAIPAPKPNRLILWVWETFDCGRFATPCKVRCCGIATVFLVAHSLARSRRFPRGASPGGSPSAPHPLLPGKPIVYETRSAAGQRANRSSLAAARQGPDRGARRRTASYDRRALLPRPLAHNSPVPMPTHMLAAHHRLNHRRRRRDSLDGRRVRRHRHPRRIGNRRWRRRRPSQPSGATRDCCDGQAGDKDTPLHDDAHDDTHPLISLMAAME